VGKTACTNGGDEMGFENRAPVAECGPFSKVSGIVPTKKLEDLEKDVSTLLPS